MKPTTLLYLRRGDQLLIAMKKRGHGAGLYNGVGGKVEDDETIEHAAIRECQEEIGVTPVTMTRVGKLDFIDGDDPNIHYFMHIFECREWEGEPHETEEMRPEWCNVDKLPINQMWPDDAIWLPYFIDGKRFIGSVNSSTTKLISHTIHIVTSLEEES